MNDKIKSMEEMEVLTTAVRIIDCPRDGISRTIKSCPDCGSIFIEDDHCESCGLRFRVDRVRSPFSERSYYQLSQDYWDELNGIQKLFPEFINPKSKKSRKYIRELTKRFQAIEEYIKGCDPEELKYYIIELEQIEQELNEFAPKGVIKRWLPQGRVKSLMTKLAQFIIGPTMIQFFKSRLGAMCIFLTLLLIFHYLMLV